MVSASSSYITDFVAYRCFDRLLDEKSKENNHKDSHGCMLLPLYRGVQISEIMTNTEGFIKRKIFYKAGHTTMKEMFKLINP